MKRKKEIVKLLLNNVNIDEKDEDELFNLLIDKPLAIDIEAHEEAKLTLGDKIADKVSEVAGSWKFIIIFSLFLIGWITLNGFFLKEKAIDEYPFILLNLLLSCIAALQAPIIMMSQNRQAKKDSLRNHNDYMTDLKSELILEELAKTLETVENNQKRILKILESGGLKDEKTS